MAFPLWMERAREGFALPLFLPPLYCQHRLHCVKRSRTFFFTVHTIWIMEKGSPLSEPIFCKTRTGFVQLPAERIFLGTVLLQKNHHTIGAATILAFRGPEQKKRFGQLKFCCDSGGITVSGKHGNGDKTITPLDSFRQEYNIH